MLAKQVADNTSSGPINVLPRQMKPHEIPVIGNGDSTAGYIYWTASEVSQHDSSIEM